ncbi:MAG: hypothetical protein LC797_20910, partial [Chloroflexi bacterium]|nr:hypothetical protein [Chloroflexota bacterium]
MVVIGDGARWIWEHVATTFGSERMEILDWYHCCQHLGAVGAAVYGAETALSKAWVHHAKDVIWQEGPDALLRLLASCRAANEEAAKALETERGYFRANAERIRYATYRDQGLPVGSGVVESAAKHLVQQRMKRAGMRRSELGARAILHLRCHVLNDDLLRQAPDSGTKAGYTPRGPFGGASGRWLLPDLSPTAEECIEGGKPTPCL